MILMEVIEMLYETICKRRSVRQYEDSLIDEDILDKIKNKLNSITRLEGTNAVYEIVDKEKIKNNRFPYAVFAYAENNDLEKIGIGYVLEELDLYIQSIGLGSLWAGMGQPLEKDAKFRIMLGFGKTNVPYRNGVADFKRKPIKKLSNTDNDVTRVARLSPSAVNFQPWFIDMKDSEIVITPNVKPFIKLLVGKIVQYDLGIVTKIVEIASNHEGKQVKNINVNLSDKSIKITLLI